MPSFMVCSIETLFVRHHHRLTLCAHHDLVFCFLKLIHANSTTAFTRCKKGSFVNKVCKISTREAWRTTRNQLRFNIIAKWHFTHVNFKNLFTTLDIRKSNMHLTVKTTRTQQRRVKYIWTVSRSDDDDTFSTLKAIHLNEQLVECLLTLIVTTTKAYTT